MANSFNNARTFSVAVLLVLLARLAIGQTQLDTNELVVGDWYNLKVESRLTPNERIAAEEISGCLVKVTDDWIVLSTIRIEGRIKGWPWISEIPYVGAAFRTVYEVSQKVTTWVPRGSAKITERRKCIAKDFQRDDPKLEGERRISYFTDRSNGTVGCDLIEGEIQGIANGQLRVITLETDPPTRKGQKGTVKKVEKRIDLNRVVCVSMQEPVEIAKPAERKQGMK